MKFLKTALSVAISSALIPINSYSQQSESGEALEEVVVTGSYIKRDKFDMASPVETIDAETILTSGQTTIGGLVRSLPYTQNVDTVANVLAAGGGQQDSNGARFNLRGLGANSTLTLMDGRRAIDPEAIATILPELAMSTVDIVLDGGAATYGTDAVAGVVNFVPLQEYDGFKIRGFYTVDEEGDAPEPKISFLWGKTFDNLNVVAAMDYSKRDEPLLRSDRPKFNKADANTSTYGNPGTFRTYNPNDNGNAAGSTLGAGTPDPGCGANNGDATDDAYAGVYPTGVAAPFFTCYYDYGEYQDYKRPNENFVVYTSLSYDLNDDVALKAIINYSDRKSILWQSPTTFNTGSNNLLFIDGTGADAHPNNPYAFDVSPDRWRPFTGPKTGMTQPSLLESNGSYTPEFQYETYQVNLGSEFDIGASDWYGEVWTVFGNRERTVSGAQVHRDRLQLALQGQGGPSGTEWFNPFATASSLSPNYGDCAAGTGTTLNPAGDTTVPCSMNTQSVVDWIFIPGSSNIESRDYWSVEGFVTGDIFELPAGPMSIAVGAQIRHTEEVDRPTYQASTSASTLGFQSKRSINTILA